MILFAIIITIILVFPSGVVLGFNIGDHRRLRKETEAITRHEHIWKVVSAQEYNEHPNWHYPDSRNRVIKAIQGPITSPKTNVLKSCFCGETKVEAVNGHWTVRELTTM